MSKKSRSRRKQEVISDPIPDMPEMESIPVWRVITLAVIITLSVVGVYWNTLNNEFLTWDDRKYIYENRLVIGDGGLKAIWTDLWSEKPKTHYYPMTFSTFWIENQLVGLSPSSADSSEVIGKAAHPLYHCTQMLLQAINSILLFFVLIGLGASFRVSAFTALVFAIHPVNVASVAWMSERNNLLSGLFFWLSLLEYIQYRRHSATLPEIYSKKALWRYLLSIALFAFALLSKSAALTLAPVLIITDRVLDRRWTWASLRRALPFLILGAVMISITASREALLAKSWFPVDPVMRPFIAVSAIVHYFLKMLIPVKQAIIYPRWAESLSEPRYWLSLITVVTVSGLVWRYRKWFNDLWLWGLGVFLVTISPILGLKYFIWMEFAFVSDHYMYLGGTGVILMVALVFERLFNRSVGNATGDIKSGEWSGKVRSITACSLAAAVLAFCGWRTVLQNRTWKNNLTLWTHTLSISPDCFVANRNLGNHYWRQKDYKTALKYYREAARIYPTYVRPKLNCALCLQKLGRVEEAIVFFKAAVKAADKKYSRSWSVHTRYATYLHDLGRLDEALAEYKRILKKDPPNASEVRKAIQEIYTQGSAAP